MLVPIVVSNFADIFKIICIPLVAQLVMIGYPDGFFGGISCRFEVELSANVLGETDLRDLVAYRAVRNVSSLMFLL